MALNFHYKFFCKNAIFQYFEGLWSALLSQNWLKAVLIDCKPVEQKVVLVCGMLF